MIEHDAAQRLFQRIKAHHQANGGTITSTEWLRMAAEEFKTFGEQIKGTKKPRREKPINKLSEEEFIAYLEAEPSLAGVDIKREIGKCQFWCKNNEAEMTRKRLINWLNKAERSVKFVGAGQSSIKTPTTKAERRNVPAGWRDFIKAKMDEWEGENGEGGIYVAPGRHALAMYDDFYRMPKPWQDEAWAKVSGGDPTLL